MGSHVEANRRYWDAQAEWYAQAAESNWSADPHWGLWRVPDSEIKLLPDADGADVVELGCGTGYVGGWLAARGANVVGIDNSPDQLATARSMQARFDLPFPLLWGDAEVLPFADNSFDVAISEYGAAIWCDPHRWIPEAARVLRPGGTLVFLGNAQVFMLCIPWLEVDGPVGTELQRPLRDMWRFDWEDSSGVEFHLSHGDWIDLFNKNGLVVQRLVEVYAGPDSETRYEHLASLDWSTRWPCEEAWVVTKQ